LFAMAMRLALLELTNTAKIKSAVIFLIILLL